MIDLEAKTDFDRDGYLLLPGFFDAEADFAALRAEYEGVLDAASEDLLARGLIAERRESLPFGERVARLVAESGAELNKYLDITLPQRGIGPETPMHCGPAVFALMRHPRLLDLVEAVIGAEIYSNPTQHVRIKPPARCFEGHERLNNEIATTVWHQDQGAVVPEADETHMLTVFIAVTEATIANGCLLVAPSSHRRGLALHCRDERASDRSPAIPDRLVGEERRPLEMKAGDLLLLNKLTMHASLPNMSDEIRWSLDFRYNPIGEPTGRPWFPGFVARSRVEPETALTDVAEWAALWDQARERLSMDAPATFQRWAADDPGCA